MPAKDAEPIFGELEWNFDTLPDNELVACCYWEYARESEFIRDTLRDYRDWFLAGAKWSDARLELDKDLERIQSMGYPSEVFVRGCAFQSGRVCQSLDPDEPNYRHPHAPVLTGSFPAPWQSLAADERRERSRIRSHRTVLPLVPIKRGGWHDAKDIAQWAEGRWQMLHAAFEKVRRENPEVSEVELITQGKLKPFPGIQPSLYRAEGSEVTALTIHWADFTNEELIQYFRRWVKVNRPKQARKPDDRGHKAKDTRANLTRLAVMRLLSRFTALDLIDPRRNKFPEIWETKQFAGRKWGDPTKWHDARREAGKLFHSLFPFLPGETKPTSWERSRPVK